MTLEAVQPETGPCEDCERETETLGAWSKPSGTAGAPSMWHTTPAPSPVVLGHDGFLCRRCWWKRVIPQQHTGLGEAA